LHADDASNPAGRRGVVGGVDLNTAIEPHGARAVLVVTEGSGGSGNNAGFSSANITAT
jgi:hypothetical protein